MTHLEIQAQTIILNKKFSWTLHVDLTKILTHWFNYGLLKSQHIEQIRSQASLNLQPTIEFF